MTASGFLDLDPEPFARDYNRVPFAFRHRLVGHPLFEWPALVALAKRLPRGDVLHRHGRVPIDTNFDHAHENHANSLSLEETLERMEEIQGYVVMNTPETDAKFRPLVDDLLAEIRRQTDRVDPGLYWHATYIFLSAGGAVTPYHMDREMNFLLQLRGTKEVQLWDPMDPAVMTDEEKERLMVDWLAPRPTWRESHSRIAMKFPLGPGDGVHHPFIAPHLVENGPELCVSLAITFRTPGSDHRGNVYKVNHHLRRLGFRPAPLGSAPRRDAFKAKTYVAVAQAAHTAGAVVRAIGLFLSHHGESGTGT